MHAHRRLRTVLLVPGLALLATCGEEAPERSGILDRETFITTYVDLRATALRSDDAALDDDERTLVLERNGVTEQELLDFAEAWGTDVEFMREVWDEVEARLDAARLVAEEESGR